MDLNNRRLQILNTLIDAYIESCEPVGSKAPVFDKFNLSSATLRNEMARLEELGLVYQPHTSAGRVPSNLGYKYYVDQIMNELAPDPMQVDRIHQITEGFSTRPERFLSQCAHMAAALTNCAAISVHSIAQHRKIIYFECTCIDEHNIAIIAVIGRDHIKTSVFTSASIITLNDATVLNRILNVNLTGIEIAKIDPTVFDMIEGEIIRYVPSMKGISHHIRSIIEELSDIEMVVCGESNLLQYPEFYDVGRLRRFYDIIADRHNFNKMVVLPQDGSIQVSIDPEFFPNASLITASLGDTGAGNTSISVIGPTRMNYQRILSDMKYFSYIVSKLMLGDAQDKKENQNGE